MYNLGSIPSSPTKLSLVKASSAGRPIKFMYPGEFDNLFRKIANIFTLETMAKSLDVTGNFPKRSLQTPIWDVMDSALDCEYIDIGDGRYVSCRHFFKRPTRILFMVLLAELEARLFRIHERNGNDIAELNDKNMNELIKELVDSEFVKLQIEYPTRAEFKEDFKAISAFRNIVMHYNKKLEKTIDLNMLIKRKKQMTKMLVALQQISDKMTQKKKD